MTKVLFVCLGNICRSPAADAVFAKLVREKGLEDRFEIDSAGTSAYHAGEKADPRMRAEGESRGIPVPSISRQFLKEDFARFDEIIVMDDSNYQNVMKLGPTDTEAQKVSKLTDYASEKYSHFDHVPDPYFGGDDGFSDVFDLIEDCCKTFLDAVRRK